MTHVRHRKTRLRRTKKAFLLRYQGQLNQRNPGAKGYLAWKRNEH